MSEVKYKVRDPKTGEVSEHTAANATDLVQHLKHQIVGRVGKRDADGKTEAERMQELLDRTTTGGKEGGAAADEGDQGDE